MEPVARLRTPGEIAAVVPLLVGFPPRESLVGISLRGPRRTVGLVLRVDLGDSPEVVEQVVRALVSDGARSVLLLVHCEDASGEEHPWAGLVAQVEAELRARRAPVVEALLVRGGRWWSYRCRMPCCPPEGRPVEVASPPVRAVAAEQAFAGRAVLASREALGASVAAQPAEGSERRQEQALADLRRRLRQDPAGTRRRELARWRAALDGRQARPVPLDPAEAARLVVALHPVLVRDQVAAWCLDRPEPLLALLLQLTPAAVPPHDAPLCAVLAWVAYAQGQGALAVVAVERALRTDPAYGLARLLGEAVDRVVPPEQVRAVLRAAADALPDGRQRRRRRTRGAA